MAALKRRSSEVAARFGANLSRVNQSDLARRFSYSRGLSKLRLFRQASERGTLGVACWNDVQMRDEDSVLRLLNQNKLLVDERDENEATPLMLASKIGHIVLQLLANKAAVNSQDSDGWTALHYAGRYRHCALLSLLVQNGADPNRKDLGGWSPLTWICYYGDSLGVDTLLRAGAFVDAQDNFYMTPIMWAAGRGHSRVVNQLLINHANPDICDKYGSSALIWACRASDDVSAKLLLASNKGSNIDTVGIFLNTALIAASKCNNTDLIRLLLKYKPSVNVKDKNSCTALYYASKHGNQEITSLLLAADSGIYIDTVDKKGNTPLIQATAAGHLGVVRCLLDRFAEVNLSGEYLMTPLFTAIEHDNLEVAEELLRRGANTELSTSTGDTPLIKAVRKKNRRAVRLLLNNNAKVTPSNFKGDTAVHVAVRLQCQDMVDLLLSNPSNGKLLYMPNGEGETPYALNAKLNSSVLGNLYGITQLMDKNEGRLLGYDLYSSSVADFLSDPHLKTPITVGLFSRWGSGTSLVLKKLRTDMELFTHQHVEPLLKLTWLVVVSIFTASVLFGCCVFLLCSSFMSIVESFLAAISCSSILTVVGLLSVGVSSYSAGYWKWARRASTWTHHKFERLKLICRLIFVNASDRAQLPASDANGFVQPNRFIFPEKITMSGSGDSEIAIATILSLLCKSAERHFGLASCRLYRLFQKRHHSASQKASIQRKHTWKYICCLPSFVWFILMTISLFAASVLSVVYFRYDEKTAFVTLISAASVFCFSLLLNWMTIMKFFVSLCVPQRGRILKSAANMHENFLRSMRQDVDLLCNTVSCIDSLTDRTTKLVIIIDGIDACEPEQLMQILEAVHFLFGSNTESMFITILSLDPNIVIQSIGQGLQSSLRGTVVNGYEYLHNVINLPFYLRDYNRTPELLETQNSTSMCNSVDWASNDQLCRKNSDARRISDMSDFLRVEDLFKVCPRHLPRIMNVIAMTARLLRAYHVHFAWNKLALWAQLCEQWPYRASWLVYYCKTKRPEKSTKLLAVYELVKPKIPVSRDEEPLMMMDRIFGDVTAFEKFMACHRPSLSCRDLEDFLPGTPHLDPSILAYISDTESAKLQLNSFGLPSHLTTTDHLPDRTPLKEGSSFISLDQFSTGDIASTLDKIEGLNQQRIEEYRVNILRLNISGIVLKHCDLSELRSELCMPFGDWHLFKNFIVQSRGANYASDHKSTGARLSSDVRGDSLLEERKRGRESVVTDPAMASLPRFEAQRFENGVGSSSVNCLLTVDDAVSPGQHPYIISMGDMLLRDDLDGSHSRSSIDDVVDTVVVDVANGMDISLIESRKRSFYISNESSDESIFTVPQQSTTVSVQQFDDTSSEHLPNIATVHAPTETDNKSAILDFGDESEAFSSTESNVFVSTMPGQPLAASGEDLPSFAMREYVSASNWLVADNDSDGNCPMSDLASLSPLCSKKATSATYVGKFYDGASKRKMSRSSSLGLPHRARHSRGQSSSRVDWRDIGRRSARQFYVPLEKMASFSSFYEKIP